MQTITADYAAKRQLFTGCSTLLAKLLPATGQAYGKFTKKPRKLQLRGFLLLKTA